MKPEAALIQFQSWAQEESVAQGRLLEALESMDSAARNASQAELAVGCEALEGVLSSGHSRSERRRCLTETLAGHFGVSPKILSLGSIIERAEAGHMAPASVLSTLRTLRLELIERAREVARKSARMAAVAGHQRGLLKELMSILGVRDTGAGELVTGGGLVNAEA